MKYAIFSDVHSNLEALRQFFAKIDTIPHLKPICLGDIVGYASHPNECIQMLCERNIPVLRGNHDAAVSKIWERKKFNSLAKAAIDWHKKQITPIWKQYLKQLPRTLVVNHTFSLTHADFSSPELFLYVTTASAAKKSFKAMKTKIGFFGHTHLPMIFIEDPLKGDDEDDKVVCRLIRGAKKMQLQKEKRYMINPGSLGQPRDGDPRMSFVVFDDNELTVSFHRLEYDCHQESKSILEAKLPKELAERILVGY